MSAYNGTDKYIFVSYCHDNKDIALPFIEELQKNYNVWYDERLSFGRAYDEEIVEKIINCSLFIFLITNKSIESEYCLNEIRFATDINQKPFINVYLEETIVSKTFDFKYGRYQYCNCYNYHSYAEAIKDIESKSKVLKAIRNNGLSENSKVIKDNDQNPSSSENYNQAITIKTKLIEEFSKYNVDAKITNFVIGSNLTKFEIKYGKSSVNEVYYVISQFKEKCSDITFDFVPVVSGKTISELYITNKVREVVDLFDAIDELDKKGVSSLAVPFGRDIDGKLFYATLNDLVNTFVGGMDGSGKSSFLHSIITSLMVRSCPDEVKFVLINQSNREFSYYDDSPFLLKPVVSNVRDAYNTLLALKNEIENRLSLLAQYQCRSIKFFNEDALKNNIKPLPRITVFIDGFDDLIYKYNGIADLTLSIIQKSRAVGVHLFVSERRFGPNDFNSRLKENFSTKIALATTDFIDSVTIISEGGAENLLLKGDMLLKCDSFSNSAIRLQSCFINSENITNVCSCMKEKFANNNEHNNFNSKVKNDVEALYQMVKSEIVHLEFCSISFIQRQYGVSFISAGKIYVRLVKEGFLDDEKAGPKGAPVIIKK